MNPELAIGLAPWVLLLIILALTFARTARRMTQLAGQTRALAAYQAAVGSIALRSAAAVDPVIEYLDEVRRRSGDFARVADVVPAAADQVHAAAMEARALRSPAALMDRTTAVVAELERSERALDLIDHGLSGLAEVRGRRELEFQTTLKRGALNLRHARDAIAGVAAEVAALVPADLRRGAKGAFTTHATPLPVWSDEAPVERSSGGSDPSM